MAHLRRPTPHVKAQLNGLDRVFGTHGHDQSVLSFLPPPRLDMKRVN
ncbi:MAG: hypothetical protein ACYCS7_12650 [Acidimicrobiales bacterium]